MFSSSRLKRLLLPNRRLNHLVKVNNTRKILLSATLTLLLILSERFPKMGLCGTITPQIVIVQQAEVMDLGP